MIDRGFLYLKVSVKVKCCSGAGRSPKHLGPGLFSSRFPPHEVNCLLMFF